MENRSMLRKIKTEYLGKSLSMLCGLFIVVLTISIIVFLTIKGLRTFTKGEANIFEFLFSTKWNPEDANPRFGALIFIVASTLVSIGAVIVSAPISIALAISMNYISPKLGKAVLQPALELFVGIPSVVYGWLGVSILVPLIRNASAGPGFSLLAGIIVLSIMILPTIATISSDAIRTVPKDYLEASYGLGATRWQTISKVIVPSALSGILTGTVLGLARAFGEALAVQMVIGNSLRMVDSLLKPTWTLTGVITMSIPDTIDNTAPSDALWTLALILLVISFIFIAIIQSIGKRRQTR